jgi:hypothetical protein
MSNDKRSYKRMVCECIIGIGALDTRLRMINISASGIAFQLYSDEQVYAREMQKIKIYLSFFGIEYKDIELKVERVESKEGKVIVACVFTNLTEGVRNEINALVESDGGYYSNDIEAKKKYFNEKMNWMGRNIQN